MTWRPMLDARGIAAAPFEADEAGPEDEADLYPVTAAQRRLWFLDRLQPGLTAYNLVITVDLQGALDLARLRAAVGAVVRRHDALRTCFVEVDGSLWQAVLPRLDVALPVIDLSGLAADRRQQAARALAVEGALAFDLRQAPLLRLRLHRRSASRHELLVEMHHIVADGRSLRIFARDLLASYAGPHAPWLSPPGQFPAFAARQAQLRTRESLEPGLAYWRERLAGAPSLQRLPLDRARPRRPSFRAAVERMTVAAAKAPALAALAAVGRGEGSTPFMTLLATWLVLLHRWSWRTDLLVGTPVTNRDRPDLAEAIGFFVDVVVIRVRADGRSSFLEMLRRTREAVLDAIAHQEVPLDLVVDALRLDRRLDHQPFLQALFGLAEADGEDLRAGGIAARLVEVDVEDSAKGDLSLILDLGENGLGAWLKYAVDLYDRSTARRLLTGYASLLAGLAADPGRPCGEVAMMDDLERQQVLREWSGAGLSGPPRCPVHERFRRCAERSPGAPALEFPDGQLSYGELEASSNRLARVLAGMGVGAESPVGVCLEPSVDLVVALLAVLKAGGAYLPLDPRLPGPRLAALVAASGMRWAVTRTEAAAGLPDGACEPLFLDRLRQRIDAADPGAFSVPCTPESLAYVLFTSGSTGVPKGVEVPHRAVHRLVVGSDFLRLGENDRVGMAAPPSFDASTLEVWGALLNGGCVVGIPGELLLSPGALFAHLAATRVTALWLTKSLFDQMARHDPAGFAGLDHLLTGGEALDTGMVRHVLARLQPGGPLLRNGYGPTENTTFTAVHAIEEVPERALSIPIGRPIRGTYVHLAGPDLQPVPAGVAGELYTGGEGLARGYLAAPALTAAAFLPDPFSEVPGARLYRTGDLARWRADGTIEFLGRIDHQLKIHGFRIEPAEIEAELALHPGVGAVAVVGREDEPGVKRLVAYVVPAGPGAPDLAGLRAFLTQRLPAYLVPHAFVALPALPVNAHGKLDREALPHPGTAILAAADEAAPRTPVEVALVEVWKEVLQRPTVGIHDNFFQIGGDSISSIRLVARARQQGLEISTGLLFEAQTVAGLAAALDQAEPVPLRPIQRWFLDEVPGAPAGYARWMVLRLGRSLEPALLDAALDRLGERHEALRRRFEGGPDGWRQSLAEAADRPRVSVHDLAGLSDFAAAERVDAEAERLAAGFDLAAAPPFRLALFLRLRKPPELLVVLHQLVADTRSSALFLAELERACEPDPPEDPPRPAPRLRGRVRAPAASGGASPAAPGAAPAATVAASSATVATSSATVAASAALGAGLARLVDDAVQRAAPPHRLDRSLSLYFTPRQTETLIERVPSRHRATAADLLLAALAHTLTRWARASSLLVDVVAPALPPEAGRTIGWLAARERLLLDLSGAAGPDSWLAAAKGARRLEPAADDRRAIPELLFVYRGAADPLPPGSLLFSAVRCGGRSDTGSVRAAHHAIGIAAAVVDGRLTIEWTYDANLFHPLVLEGLMREHASAIMGLAEHCLESPPAGYTAADFPLAGLDRDGLELLLGPGREIEDLYPLTLLQESMLAHNLGLPRSEVNFEQLCHALEGDFDAVAFGRAWELALERHTILRTAFLWRGLARPLQAVRRNVRLPLRVFDWRRLGPRLQERSLARLLERDRAKGFQLDRAPLLRLAIARVADDRAYVVLSFHHALLDGWSLERLDREILQGFQALRSGAAPAFEPARPFRDYVAWLERQDPGEARDAFRAVLGSFREPVEVPGGADGGAPLRSGERRRVLSEEESARLGRFARRHGITPGTLAQAAWGLWLGRAFGRDDVVFGLTASGRPADLPGVEGMLGLFIHNLPVRVRLGGEPLLAWLLDLQAQVAKTAGLAPIPEAELQRLSGIAPSRRLYETLVVVENLPSGDEAWSALEDLRLERVSSQLETRHPLTLVVIPGERIELRLVHHVPRFPGDAAQQILDDVCATLLALPAAADLGTAALPEPRSARALLPGVPLPGQAAGGARPDLPAVMPRDLLELRLSQVAEEVLERRPPGVTANLFDCGLDSVRLARLSRRLGEELGRDLPFAVLFERPTVAGLAEWLRAGGAAPPWSPLVAIQTAAHSTRPRPAFYCVHPLAGNVIAFLALASAMGEDQPFYALQAPGADGREEPLDRLEDIAAMYVEAVRRRQPKGPYRLGGYSFGGVVAFEMARQMYEQGDEIALLAILDTPAPREPHPGEPEGLEGKDDLFWLRQIVHMRERFLGLDLGLAGEGLRELGEEDRLRRVAAVLASAEVLPADADAALMRQLVRVSRAQYRAYVGYRPAGPYPGRIMLVRSADLHRSEASAHLRQAFQDPAMGWGALSPLPVRVIHVAGDHVTMLVRPQVETVASRLREAILAG